MLLGWLSLAFAPEQLRVATVEASSVTLAAVALLGPDTAMGGRIASWTAHSLIWRDGLGGLPSPGPLWLAAWTLYGVPHSFATSWLWGGMAANYPSGRLKATFLLASRAGRRTPWLFHSTLGTSVILGVLTSGVPGFRLLRKR